VNFNLYREAD